MNKLQTNVNDIKAVAKTLKQELATMNFELSHSSALNLASRSLGFKNYQAYNGLLEKKNDNDFKLNIMSIAELDIKVEKEKLKNYPQIYNRFVKFGNIQKYDIYIDRELSNDEYNYYLIFELKKSYTGRIFFVPEYIGISFFRDNTSGDYFLKLEHIDTRDRVFEYFEIIKHVNNKNWMTKEILSDLMSLMESLKKDYKSIIDISSKYSNEELEKKYKKKKYD